MAPQANSPQVIQNQMPEPNFQQRSASTLDGLLMRIMEAEQHISNTKDLWAAVNNETMFICWDLWSTAMAFIGMDTGHKQLH